MQSISPRASVFALLAIAAVPTLAAQSSSAAAPAATGAPILGVRHVIGLDNVKFQSSGQLSIQSGALLFDAGKSESEILIASIDDIFLGSETTQARSKTARVVKVAAIAAPYESGRALSLFMRTKVDILTIQYHDPNGGVHGAIFAIPKGLAAGVRTQLIAAGAHASAPAEEAPKEVKKP